MFDHISASVGKDATNIPEDVLAIQYLLNVIPHEQGGAASQLAEDGMVGNQTITAIERFQKVALGFQWPDGRFDVGGKTFMKLIELAQAVLVSIGNPAIGSTGTSAPSVPCPPAYFRNSTNSANGKKFKCLTHYHRPADFAARMSESFNSLIDTPEQSYVKMTPHTMNPGYFSGPNLDAPDNTSSLHSQLKELLEESKDSQQNYKYKPYLHKISIGLVDLTGLYLSLDTDLTGVSTLKPPEFAGWRETRSTRGGSLAKIPALYALHQLKTDLEYLAGQTTMDIITTAHNHWSKDGLTDPSRYPKIDKLFKFGSQGGVITVAFADHLKKLLEDIYTDNSNTSASILMEDIGFDYLHSTLVQSGIFHHKEKGLWPGQTYTPSYPRNVFFFPPGTQYYNVTALSVATYFTLLAQNRLASHESSDEIKDILRTACSLFAHHHLPEAVTKPYQNAPRKCGIDGGHSKLLHDAMYVNRDDMHYVVVLLTENAIPRGLAPRFFNDFINDVHHMILDRNMLNL